jgi:hypothetical protein
LRTEKITKTNFSLKTPKEETLIKPHVYPMVPWPLPYSIKPPKVPPKPYPVPIFFPDAKQREFSHDEDDTPKRLRKSIKMQSTFHPKK